ncbi:MAG: DUF1772 domain-containing protein [Chromatiales bacterium]|jgi:uncharacterized membrane protein
MASVDHLLLPLTFVALLGSGLMAGLFFVFSVAVMKGFSRLPVHEGIAAMQSINVAIINPVFFLVFFGTAASCAAVVVVTMMRWGEPGNTDLMLGGALYLIGGFLVTLIFNVPRNKLLGAVSPTDPDSVHLWSDYLDQWTRWNHVRTIASLAALAFLSIGLCQLRL